MSEPVVAVLALKARTPAPFDGNGEGEPGNVSGVYDCLTENVEAISSGESGVATEAEIEQRIIDTNRDQCSKWVTDQLVGKDGAPKPQEPVPLRVVWSSDGPRTDPSMFSRAPDEL